MPVSAPTRKFHRTEISPREKLIGSLVIMALAATGIVVYLKGQNYDPSRYTGSAEALEFTREAVTGIAATVRNAPDLRASELIGSQGAALGPQIKDISTYGAALQAMGPTEHYVADTLYEKINGRAPAYLEYNFQELTCRSFTVKGTTADFIDVYLFRMDSPLNAFGIFSAERDDSGQALDFVADGYASEMGYFLRRGDTYVQILASSTEPVVMDTALEFTRQLVLTLPADTSGMEGRSFLPEEGQITGSLTYINDNAYGQASLSEVFEARYNIDGKELTYFVKSASDATVATSVWTEVKNFYDNYGSQQESMEMEGTRLFSADMFGQWAAIYVKDNRVAGVVNAPDRQSALEFVQSQLGEGASASEETEEYPF